MQFPKQLRTPVAAALLSALWPGLGQWAAGWPRRGAIVSIPRFAIVFSLLVIAMFDRNSLFNLGLNQQYLTSILIVLVIMTLYDVWAIVDAYLIARPDPGVRDRRRGAPIGRRRWSAILGVLLIVTATFAVHAKAATYDMDLQRALYCLHAPIPCWVSEAGTPDPNASDDSVNQDVLDTPTPIASGGKQATATPMVTYDPNSIQTFNPTIDAQQWNADGEFNVLLLGLGVQSNKAALGPDTIMVLHANMSTGAAELVSVGRNNYCTPLPTKEVRDHYPSPANGCPPGTYGQMLNGLPNEILGHCDRWPIPEYVSTCGKGSADDNRYLRAYKGFEMTIGNLLGLHIDGSMWINPTGLTTLIDALGGVTITVGTRLYDKPCGPAGSTQQKVAATLTNVPGTNTCADTSHWGYFVPTAGTGVGHMKDLAAASNGGLAVYSIPNHPSDVALVIQPGTYHMNGDWALAYARTRIYDPLGDFGRAARQQNMLSSLRKTLDPCNFASIGNVLPLLGAVQAVPYGFNSDLDITNPDNIKAWANLAKSVLGDNVKQIVLTPASVGMSGYAWDPTSIAKAQQLIKTNFVKPAAASPGASGGSKTC